MKQFLDSMGSRSGCTNTAWRPETKRGGIKPPPTSILSFGFDHIIDIQRIGDDRRTIRSLAGVEDRLPVNIWILTAEYRIGERTVLPKRQFSQIDQEVTDVGPDDIGIFSLKKIVLVVHGTVDGAITLDDEADISDPTVKDLLLEHPACNDMILWDSGILLLGDIIFETIRTDFIVEPIDKQFFSNEIADPDRLVSFQDSRILTFLYFESDGGGKYRLGIDERREDRFLEGAVREGMRVTSPFEVDEILQFVLGTVGYGIFLTVDDIRLDCPLSLEIIDYILFGEAAIIRFETLLGTIAIQTDRIEAIMQLPDDGLVEGYLPQLLASSEICFHQLVEIGIDEETYEHRPGAQHYLGHSLMLAVEQLDLVIIISGKTDL